MDAAAPGARSRAFSWNVALLLASGAIWTAAAGSLSSWAGNGDSALGGIRAALWLGAAGTALSAPAFLLLPRGPAPARESEPGLASGGRRLEGLALPRKVVWLVGAIFVWMLGAALVLPFFNLYFQRVHGLSVERIGLLFAAVQALTAVVVFGGGELAQRLGPRRAFTVWAPMLPLALLLLVSGPILWIAVAAYAMQSLPSPATNPLLDEIVLDEAPDAQRGAASSWRNAATEASGLVGAALGGIVLERAGFGVLMAAAAVVAALGASMLLRSLGRGTRPA
jgi:predicted MFS family arabinose efflux permease